MERTETLFAYTPEELWQQLETSYDRWYHLNDVFLNFGQKECSETFESFAELEEEFAPLYETIAEIALDLYKQSYSAKEYKEKIEHLVAFNPQTRKRMDELQTDDPFYAAQNIERFGYDVDALTPAESLLATANNLVIAEDYVAMAGEFAEGALLSGSSAWGSNFATRNARPELGKLRGKASDIDLLIEVTDCANLQKIINAYKHAGLIDEREVERFSYFADQYNSTDPNKAQMYSLRSHATGHEVSIHFITSDVMERIVTLEEKTHSKAADDGEVEVAFLKDFRPNTTSNGANGRGYDMHDVQGEQSVRFHPENKAAPRLGDDLYGYVAESPLGAVRTEKDNRTYLMGVIPYFLAVHPIALGTNTAHMKQRIETMQRSIAQASEGKAVSVPRLERMTLQTRQRVLGALQLQ